MTNFCEVEVLEYGIFVFNEDNLYGLEYQKTFGFSVSEIAQK